MRDYDPTTGRYLQPDPLGLIDGASVYGYARQSPMQFTDPTGQCPVCLVIAGEVALNLAIGYTIDQIWGDQCYTLEEGLIDAILGLALGPLGRGAFAGDDLAAAVARLRGGAGKNLIASALDNLGPPQGHHPIPMYLGGNRNQPLASIPSGVHGALHRALDGALKDAGIPLNRGGRGGGYDAWARHFADNPGSQQKALDTVAGVTSQIDQAFGTNVSGVLNSNLLNNLFTRY